MTDVHEIHLDSQVRMNKIMTDGVIDSPDKIPYIIYHGTIFVRSTVGGYELLPTYNGKVEGELPDYDVINNAIEYEFDDERIALIPYRDGYEALPGWGVKSANLLGIWNIETLNTILGRPDVQAVIWVKGDEIEYIEEPAPGQTE